MTKTLSASFLKNKNKIQKTNNKLQKQHIENYQDFLGAPNIFTESHNAKNF